MLKRLGGAEMWIRSGPCRRVSGASPLSWVSSWGGGIIVDPPPQHFPKRGKGGQKKIQTNDLKGCCLYILNAADEEES